MGVDAGGEVGEEIVLLLGGGGVAAADRVAEAGQFAVQLDGEVERVLGTLGLFLDQLAFDAVQLGLQLLSSGGDPPVPRGLLRALGPGVDLLPDGADPVDRLVDRA